mmetsp:Transcript_65897/g.192773  ORF Transcript_65897/g.192773 Transcript_65897/m.192773 type:complete len:253 (-) Transcript_65897:2389-3147(-)
MEGPELAAGPDELVEVVPALRVDHQLDLGALLLLVDLPQPVVEEGRIGNCGGERDEGAGDELHAVLPLRAALLLPDAVHLVEDDPPQPLDPVLGGGRQEQHLQDVGDGHQDLAVPPLARLHDAACGVELLEEDPQELALRVGGVRLAGEARVDLRTDLVHQGLRGSYVHRNAVVVCPEHPVHHVVSDEGLPAGGGRDHQGRALVVDDVQKVPLPPVRLEVDALLGVLAGAHRPRHVPAHVHELEGVLVLPDP